MEWSKKEIQILKNIFPKKGIKDTKEVLKNRSKNAILLKASNLGIRRRSNYIRKTWTKSEVSNLKKYYPTSPRKELYHMLPDRNYSQIKQKANKLKIKRKVALSFKGFKKLKISNTDKAYIAGLLDGEGHISLHKYKKKNCTYYGPEIGISNTDKNVMEYLFKKLKEGGVKINSHTQKRGKNKPVITARINSHTDAHCLLKYLMPYLKIKHERAQEIIKFIEKKSKKENTKECLKRLNIN
tara:strand:- start:211 stop:930 length:720 start_codon:yes stop_codon:yes gene_type:complete